MVVPINPAATNPASTPKPTYIWQQVSVEPQEFIDWLKGYSKRHGGQSGEPPTLHTIIAVEKKLTKELVPDELRLLHEISLAFSAGGDAGRAQDEIFEIREHFRKKLPV